MDDITPAFAWGVFLTLVGLAGLGVFGGIELLVRRRQHIARRLDKTTGVLRDAWAKRDRSFWGSNTVGWLPFGKYEYEVAGQPYTGRQITFQVHGFPGEAAALAQFGGRPGDAITVYYDRMRPGLSVLSPEPPVLSASTHGLTIASAVAVIVGVVLAAIGYT